MRLHPVRAAVALAITAAVVAPAAPATAKPATKCLTIPGTWALGEEVAFGTKICIPWPFPI